MSTTVTQQRPINTLLQEILPQLYLSTMFEDYLKAKKIEGLSEGTLEIYHRNLKNFIDYCDTVLIKNVTQVDVGLIRDYMNFMTGNGHNPGGCHQAYRSIRSFIYWSEAEEEDSDEIKSWSNPFRSKRLKAPKLTEEPLEPVPDDVVRKMLDSCDKSLKGLRDKAILMVLTDTGVRAAELYHMLLSDVNFASRSIVVTKGKGGKPRPVFFCRETKKVLVAYLRKREDRIPYLFVTLSYRGRDAKELDYSALRDLIDAVSKKAGVETPTIHSFRRTFAITMLRNGTDIFTLQRLMGHADLQILRRYLRQNITDLKAAHDKFSPVASLHKKSPYS